MRAVLSLPSPCVIAVNGSGKVLWRGGGLCYVRLPAYRPPSRVSADTGLSMRRGRWGCREHRRGERGGRVDGATQQSIDHFAWVSVVARWSILAMLFAQIPLAAAKCDHTQNPWPCAKVGKL